MFSGTCDCQLSDACPVTNQSSISSFLRLCFDTVGLLVIYRAEFQTLSPTVARGCAQSICFQ